jgi:putative membrane protein
MNDGSIYTKFPEEELILRDYLAVYRTVLANEQALLSYIRTALATGAAGATLLHFVDSQVSQYSGWALLMLTFVILILGIYRYFTVRRLIELEHSELKSASRESDVDDSFFVKYLYWKTKR